MEVSFIGKKKPLRSIFFFLIVVYLRYDMNLSVACWIRPLCKFRNEFV